MTYHETSDSILTVENLSVDYDGKKIIQNINFDEKDITRPNKIQGQSIAFVGRSGRGKSTLFRCLSGLEKPKTGKVLLPDMHKHQGEAYPPMKEVGEGDVGFVDQKYTLFRHKTVYQALQFAMRKQKLEKSEKHDKIMVHLRDWGLETVKDQYPNELSGGQRQRTAILEQVLSHTNYIIMDEPFSGLDVGNINNVKSAFKLINESHELNTVIFCTHDIELAVALAESLYVLGYPTLENGRLEPIGTLIKKYDLKSMGLAWHDQLTNRHYDVVEQVKQSILES